MQTRRRVALLCAVLGVLVALGAGSALSKPTLAAPTISSGPASATTSRTAAFTFTGPAGATFSCSLDNAAYAACTSPKAYGSLGDGSHSFRVISVKSGDQSDPATWSWIVDNVAPGQPSISSAPPSLAGSRTATFGFAGPESGLRYACSLDGGAFATCTSPTSYSNLAEGNHTFAVRATDAAGNTGPNATHAWKVDTVAPPAPTITVKPTDPTPNATNDFAWTDTEAGVGFQCSFENGAFSSCGSPYRWVIGTSNYGQHQFAVRAVDAAGNVSATTAYVFKYEKGLPTSGVPFQISGSVPALSIGVWKPITLTLTNPNPVAIYVSALQVSVAADSTPSGCSSAANIEVEQSDVSTTRTVTVPANGTVTLPNQGVATPRMRLKNLPNVNQDVCKGKSFALSFSGTATN